MADYRLITWLEAHTLPCPFKLLTGCECPMCGLQRSILLFFRGEIRSSIAMHPAGILFLAMVIFLFINIKMKFTIGNTVLKYWLIVVFGISIINYVLRFF